MTSSPARNNPSIPLPTTITHHLSSPRSTRTLRKLQSAHQLSSNYNAFNTPSLISQQRQQQQQQRNTSMSQKADVPPVPSIPTHHSPSKPAHHRTRSNSDAVNLGEIRPLPGVRRAVAPRRKPKDELKSLMTHGPQDDMEVSLQHMRRLILEGGMDAEHDGTVLLRSIPTFQESSNFSIVHHAHLHLANFP